MPEQRTCLECKAPFTVKVPSSSQRCCSRKCAAQAREKETPSGRSNPRTPWRKFKYEGPTV